MCQSRRAVGALHFCTISWGNFCSRRGESWGSPTPSAQNPTPNPLRSSSLQGRTEPPGSLTGAPRALSSPLGPSSPSLHPAPVVQWGAATVVQCWARTLRNRLRHHGGASSDKAMSVTKPTLKTPHRPMQGLRCGFSSRSPLGT